MISHHTLDILALVLVVCSLLGSFLPPYEVFNFAPRFQTAYRIFMTFIVQIGALNLRSIMMKFYSSYQGGQNGSSKVVPISPASGNSKP